MKKVSLLFLPLFIFISSLKSQDDSCKLRFSLLTCTPGDELYSSFGHSAIRLQNSDNGSDLVFNYGTFDFDDPDFYTKFTRGKLLYFVSVDKFDDFMFEYEYFNRGVTEQVLNLTCEEKSKLLYALYENAREENKYYKYDFTFDNCTTRLRDILRKTSTDSIVTKNILPAKNISFRNLIHEYLDKGQQDWSKLGIDILLGANLDREVTNNEAMFLPDYLMKAFDSSQLGNRPLVLEKKMLLTQGTDNKQPVLFTPVLIFSLLFLVVLALSLSKNKPTRSFLKGFDILFFFITGLIGCLLIFMWTGTDHYMCRNNLNIMWALPAHLIMSFFVFSNKPWVKRYFLFSALLSLALAVTWFFLPQEFNMALLPVTGILCVRSFINSKQTS